MEVDISLDVLLEDDVTNGAHAGGQLRSSHHVVLCLHRKSVSRSLPLAEGLGLVVVTLHWPVPRHVHHVKHQPQSGGGVEKGSLKTATCTFVTKNKKQKKGKEIKSLSV